jgi:hypothetical protein
MTKSAFQIRHTNIRLRVTAMLIVAKHLRRRRRLSVQAG